MGIMRYVKNFDSKCVMKIWFYLIKFFFTKNERKKGKKKERRKKVVYILSYGLPYYIKKHITISPIKYYRLSLHFGNNK